MGRVVARGIAPLGEAIEPRGGCRGVSVTRHGVVAVGDLARWDVVGDVGDGVEHVRLRRHLGGDAVSEFLHLAAEVEEEGVALPAANKHDGGGAYVGKVE